MKFQAFMKRSLLMQTHQEYHRHFLPLTSELRNKGVNLNEALILLATFFEQNQRVTPSQLQDILFLPKDQISHALRSLEKKSLTERRISETDQRQRLISTTEKGRKVSQLLIKDFDHYEDRLERFRSAQPQL